MTATRKTPFELWWIRNKWKGTQWYSIYVAEDAYKEGFKQRRHFQKRRKKRLARS